MNHRRRCEADTGRRSGQAFAGRATGLMVCPGRICLFSSFRSNSVLLSTDVAGSAETAALFVFMTISNPVVRSAAVYSAGGVSHANTQAQRTHVRPNLFDVAQTLRLRSRLARIPPAQSVAVVRGPDGILLFVVDDHSIKHRFFGSIRHGDLSL